MTEPPLPHSLSEPLPTSPPWRATGTLALIILASLITLAALVYAVGNAQTLTADAHQRQENRAKELAQVLSGYALRAEQLAATVAALVAPLREDRAEVETILGRVLLSAPAEIIYGIGAWYEPEAFLSGERYFGPYVHQTKGANEPITLTYEWTTPAYNFHTQPWYVAGKAGSGKTIFTTPYFDTGLIYMSATRAFFGGEGVFRGVVTVDMVLPLVREVILRQNTTDGEIIYVTTADGSIFVHPQEDALLAYARQTGKTPISILDLKDGDYKAYLKTLSTPAYDEAEVSVPAVNWVLHLDTNQGLLYAEVGQFRSAVFTALGLLWLVTGVAGTVMYRSGRQLAQQKAAQRRLELLIEARHQSETALKEMNTFLEARVAERTAELSAAKNAAEKANQVKSIFLASMSHELRTPLNAILNFVKFVGSGMMGPINDKQTSALDKAFSSGEHLLSLINDVLDISKIESGAFQFFIEPDVNLHEELGLVVAAGETYLRDKKKDVRLEVDIPEDLPLLTGDKQRTRQILYNLVSNACKFTEQGTVSIRVQRDGEGVLCRVADTGMGIEDEEQKTIFEIFRQSRAGLKYGGTGLGLPIAKRLSEGLGGRLWVESEMGKGATFYVWLPIQCAETARTLQSIGTG
ncbi:MAG TPA: ATP-binding protein [Aggregatilineales bacterium]|nr:hypothetical protein [Anaerolineales bacterium]HRE46112.1 ATP-binding protein [Aggregatilineales bacterium]